MEFLVAACHGLVPFSLDLILKVSLAAGAALAALKLARLRSPTTAFTLLATALLVGAGLAFVMPLLPAEFRGEGGPLALVIPGRSEGAGELEGVKSLGMTNRPRLPIRPAAALRASALPEEPVPTAAIRADAAPAPGSSVSGQARGSSWRNWIALFGALWLLGALLDLARRIRRYRGLARALREARPCGDERANWILEAARRLVKCRFPVRLLVSPRAPVAFCAGYFRASVVLPEEALSWPEGRLQATILHETKHAARCDNLLFEAMSAVAGLAWPSPLPWLSLRAAMLFREEACDAAALAAGIAPASYAADLLAAARSLASRSRQTLPASMVGKGRLERRITAVLAWRPAASDGLRGVLAALVLAFALGVSAFALSVSPEAAVGAASEAAIRWEALRDAGSGAERPAADGSEEALAHFSLRWSGELAELRIDLGGRTHELRYPAARLPSILPLAARPRFGVPNGQVRPALTSPAKGWSIWADRPAVVRAAGPGLVVLSKVDGEGVPVLEIEHGEGFRTRYRLLRYGSLGVTEGSRVEAGEPIGSLGEGRSDDIPYLDFSIIVELGGRRLSLDPAPFLLHAAEARSSPFGASVMNAIVRRGDAEELSRLLALGVDPNTTAVDHTFPLEWAIMNQDAALARLLVASGADPAAKTARDLGMFVEGIGRNFANTGPSIAEYAGESGNPELLAALFKPATH